MTAAGLLLSCATQTRRGYHPDGVPVEAYFEGNRYVGPAVLGDRFAEPIDRIDSIPLPPKKARIVVIRPGDSQALLKLAAGSPDQLAGLIDNHGCLVWDRDPGPFTFKTGFGFHPSAENVRRKDDDSITANVAVQIDNPSKQIAVSAPAGKVQYIVVKGFIDLGKSDPFGMDVIAVPPESAEVRSINCQSVRYSRDIRLQNNLLIREH